MSGPPSERIRIKRYDHLAHYDHETIYSILDAMPMCCVGYVFEGRPYVTPTLQWREGNHVYWHGSSASRMLPSVENSDVCMTVSIIDGLVCARSAYNYNVNHRSVMILGEAKKIADPEEKKAHLQVLVNKVIPNQWDRLRPVKAQELKATTLMSMSIDEASAKVRVGQTEDEPEDYAFPVWADYVPLRYELLPPIADPRNLEGIVMPDDILKFKIG